MKVTLSETYSEYRTHEIEITDKFLKKITDNIRNRVATPEMIPDVTEEMVYKVMGPRFYTYVEDFEIVCYPNDKEKIYYTTFYYAIRYYVTNCLCNSDFKVTHHYYEHREFGTEDYE